MTTTRGVCLRQRWWIVLYLWYTQYSVYTKPVHVVPVQSVISFRTRFCVPVIYLFKF